MRLNKIRIRNFRSYDDSGELEVGDKLVLVGENNAGKSNILGALDMFLDVSPTSPQEIQDYHKENTDQNIEIEAWFTEFDDEEMEIFEDYIRDDDFWVKTVYPFNDEKETVANKNFVVKTQIPEIEEFRAIDDKSADRVQEIYKNHDDKLEPHRVDDWSGNLYKNEIVPTVVNYLNSDEAEWTTEEVTNPKGIKSKLRENLPEFQYFESDRNIAEETKTSTNALLGQLLDKAMESVDTEQRDEIKDALSEVDQKLNEEEKFEEIKSLEKEIREKLNQHVPVDNLQLKIAVPDLDDILGRVNVSVDDGVSTDIQNMGSGLHTSFILASLWQLSEQEGNNEDIIFGLEEPENDLHPHAQRQLYDTLDELSNQDYQVFLSTHSAFLVSADDLFSTVRVEKREVSSQIYRADDSEFTEEDIEKVRAKIRPENNEMFFSRAVLMCEGQSEWRTIPVLNSMLHEAKDEVYAFDRLGISLVEVNGKMGFKNLLKVTEMFNIPSIVMIDNDRKKDDGHSELVELIESRADQIIELPKDLEHQFFTTVSFEQFSRVLRRISGYDQSADDLHKMRDGMDVSKEEVLRQEFGRVEPPKPQFGQALAKEIDVAEIPEELEEVIDETKSLA